MAPQPFAQTAARVLAPGYGISVSFAHSELAEAIHIHNVYLPPDARAATAWAVCEALAAMEPAPGLHFMTGDFNAQVGSPGARRRLT